MEYFKTIDGIKYEGRNSINDLAYKYYDAEQVIDGKPMHEHLRFAICFWHTMTYMGTDPFGAEQFERTWYDDDPMTCALNRVDAFFELLTKLDVRYFCFHDVDIAPEGDSLEEFFRNIDQVTDYIKEKMDETGIKLLWNTANLFSNPRYVKGGGTSPEASVYAVAAAQIKKGLEISKKLMGENYVFWGGREGYETLLNTDMEFEQRNMAYLLNLAHEYALSLNHDVQFLLEPKPKEPMTHQYDFDAATTISFLRKYNLDSFIKLNLEANHATLAGHTFHHEICVARIDSMLGSLDANQGDPLLGWDIDEFPTDQWETTLALYEVIKNGGIAPGGINFDAKVRRTSFEMIDLILAHIVGMDTYTKAYLDAHALIEDAVIETTIKNRYQSFESKLGQSIVHQQTSLEALSTFALENDCEPLKSDHTEVLKAKINRYIYK